MNKNNSIKAVKIQFSEMIEYSENGIISKIIIKNDAGNITLFSFDKGQELSEHSAPYDALVQIIEGESDIFIDGQLHQIQQNESIILPANIPHAVKASKRFKMLLTMIKS